MSERARRLFQEGNRTEALAAAKADHDPDRPETTLLLGLISALSGEVQDGKRWLEQGLASGAGEPRHWRVLAAVRRELGDRPGEADALAQAVRLQPDDATVRLHYTAALIEAGRGDEALESAVAALKLKDGVEARRLFLGALKPGRADAEMRELVLRALREWWGRRGALTEAATAIIKAEDRPPQRDDLLAELLTSAPIRDPELERRLTELRRRYLLEGPADPAFVEKLAAQGYINEYCWRVTDEERQAVQRLADAHPLRAMYEAPPDPIRADVPVLTPIRRGVSEAVRDQYEANPYPRWAKLGQQDPQPLERTLRAMFPRVRVDPIPGTDILVAGCGTGQHALEVASRYQGAEVLAVDLSLASLSYAMNKAEQYGRGNVVFGQADLMELGCLGRTFASVECAGTLHHLADPMEGFRVLAGLVRPGGVMKIALYSRKARAELAPAMALARAFDPSVEGIRAFRRAVMDAPEGDPVRAALGWGDFYTASECRDLLLHVQEHQHDVADIQQMVDQSGFRFLGFSAPAPMIADYLAAYPEDPAATDLGNWDAYEAARPRAFRQMYQFWLQRPA